METERSRLSRLCISLLTGGLRAVGLHQAAAKIQDSLGRRRLRQVARTVRERCHAYRKSLGFVRGLTTYVRCMFPRNGRGKLIEVRAPGLEAPLLLRAGTPDVTVFEQVYIDRLQDVDEPRTPKLIIDAGAHIGCVTAAFASKFPESSILAIEPDIANYALLSRNVAPYRNVLPIRAAVWHKPAVLLINNPDSESWTFQMRERSTEESGCTIGLTIAELLKWSGMDIDILKLDVEGAEREIFAAPESREWLRHVGQIRLELHDRMIPGCNEAVEQAVARDGNRFQRSVSGEYTILRRIA